MMDSGFRLSSKCWSTKDEPESGHCQCSPSELW